MESGRRRYVRRRKQPRRAGGPDLISGLGDDVIVRILELLPDAVDAARTHALSRRWRGLWTRVPTLRFVSGSRREFRKTGGPERFAAFVDAALALRAAQADPAMHRLEISFTPHNHTPEDQYAAPPCVAAARGWVRHAALHAVKSLDLELHLPVDLDDDELLPCGFDRLETLRLELGDARVRLPSTAVFASLTELSLESINFAAAGNNLLARFLSSACCPRLRKLWLSNLMLPKPSCLVLDNDTLSELYCEDKKTGYDFNPWILELRTPSLRILRLDDCSGEIDDLIISAPRLEELTFREGCPNRRIVSDGKLPCVGSLKVALLSHGRVDDEQEDDDNHVDISLLHYCTSVKHLDVSLLVTENKYQVVDIISGRIPHLPSVTSLTVHVSSLGRLHYFGAGIEDLLTQCSSNLRYLRLHIEHACDISKQNKSELDFLCNHPNPWESNGIFLLQLEEVELSGLTGSNCELRFMRSVLSNAPKLQKVAVSFNLAYRLEDKRNTVELIPQLGSGKWTPCHDSNFSYKWMP